MILNVQIPAQLNCEVMGYLYDSEDPGDLGQTMVEVTTQTDVLIQAGWEPEGSPEGAYRIAATRGMRMLCRACKTTDIHEAAACIERWARFFSGEPTVAAASIGVLVQATPIDFDSLDAALPGASELASSLC